VGLIGFKCTSKFDHFKVISIFMNMENKVVNSIVHFCCS